MAAACTTTTTLGFSLTSPMAASRRVSPLFLSDSTTEEQDPKLKIANDLRRLFDIGEMAYTVMVREESKGPDGKLTPSQLIAAIQKDGMFGEDFEDYCKTHANNGDDIEILEIGKFADDGQSSEPIDGTVLPGKGNYLVHLSFAEGVLATMRVVVD